MQRLQNLISRDADTTLPVECVVEFGAQFSPPGERILEIARDRAADLIVLGLRRTHGAGSAVTHLTRTTAQHLVAHALCPVLTVRG